MTDRELREAVDVYTELLRAYQLNIDLLETLELTLISVRQFCEAHNIPCGNTKIGSLLSKANALLEEIALRNHPTKVHMKPKSDEDFTEPAKGFWSLFVG